MSSEARRTCRTVDYSKSEAKAIYNKAEHQRDQQAADADISLDTIGQALNRVGIHSRSPWKTPLLNSRHVNACLAFARDHLEKPVDFCLEIRYCGVRRQNWSSFVETAYSMFGERKVLHMIQNTQCQPLSMVEAA